MEALKSLGNHSTALAHGHDQVIGSFLAAAVGDAFGWPFEDRSHRINGLQDDCVPEDFVDWTRRVGTRFLAFEEPVVRGSYSDDTQLILATARSLLRKDWWSHFTQVELPMWSTYERGGGGATKRAVDLWLQRKPPWRNPRGAARYFAAGGNGAAMRILPHAVLHASAGDFETLRSEIIRNSLATHGHPRAVLGALLHGYALWLAFRQRDTLGFGALIMEAIEGVANWARMPEPPLTLNASQTWDPKAGYFRVWESTVDELLKLLHIAQNGIKLGSLTTGREVLAEMGAFSRQISGAGTVSAAAAIFLSSRYAAAPLQGMFAAATGHGSDTDTLASMVGSLLGAIHGTDWLGRFGTSVQDAKYIRNIASRLAFIHGEVIGVADVHESAVSSEVTRASIRKFYSDLERKSISDEISLPDGKNARITECQKLPSRHAAVRMWIVSTDDGQTLFFTRARKERAKKEAHFQLQDAGQPASLGLIRFGIRLLVRNLAEAKRFYIDQLGLSIERESANGFTVNGTISVHEDSTIFQQQPELGMSQGATTMLCLKVEDVDVAYEHLRRSGTDTLGTVTTRKGVRLFHVRDPSGNVIEIFGAKT